MAKSNRQKVRLYRPKKKIIPEEQEIAELQSKYKNIDVSTIKTFDDIPLSSKTRKGLRAKIGSTKNEYIEPTDIQKDGIAHALAGNDILASAKTGSGKTLAFLIPVLEILYCKRWSREDGLGALIITPTRELAVQIFNTFNAVGKYHGMVPALVVGGQGLNFESKRIDQCNIIICTPGRLLDHMDKNPLFDCTSMQILVLDEADRCLDMGFREQMNAIIENLPEHKQTLLYSATQTRSVKELARLNLKNPVFIGVHERSKYATPKKLHQFYTICKLEEKMKFLWSFIIKHRKNKLMIFFSTCKEVKFIHDAFRRISPDLHLAALHGKISQPKRLQVYHKFCSKPDGTLLATDIASRGLDFPCVDIVVQMDCPEDENTYIHRVGRTARFEKSGKSLLVLLPSEKKMIQCLEQAKIPIKKYIISDEHVSNTKIQTKLESLLAKDNEIKKTAQRAFTCYMKSVYFMKDKSIFDVTALDAEAYAKSLGLFFAPKMTIFDKANVKKKINKNYNANDDDGEIDKNILKTRKSDDEESNSDDDLRMINKKKKIRVKKDKPNREELFNHHDSDDGDEFLTIKKSNVQINDIVDDKEIIKKLSANESKNKKKPLTKPALAKKILKKKIKPNKKIAFDDEGAPIIDPTKEKVSELARKYDEEDDEKSGINIEQVKQILMEEDKFDKQRFREKIRAQHREEKRKAKAEKRADKNKEEEDDDDDNDDNAVAENHPRLASGCEEDDSDGPDLSWLPDPDKIYGPKKDSDEEADGSENEKIEQVHRPPKRKLVTTKDNKMKQKKQKIDDIIAAEELALQFLNN